MANWTTEQVQEWLKTNGLEIFVKPFKEWCIDGASLPLLNDDAITRMLPVGASDEKQNKAMIEKLKQKLHEWKMEHNLNIDRRSERRRSSSRTSSTTRSKDTNDVPVSNENTDTTYKKTLTLTPANFGVNLRFFNNVYFRTKLQMYLSEKCNIKCSIELEKQNISLTLLGSQQNITTTRDLLKSLFQSIQSKIYNSEAADQKIIYWSRNIFSDAAIDVIQQIMNNEKIFTVWDKTEMFSGYYKVLYFTYDSFGISEDKVTQILNREIDYTENIKMPNEKTKNFIKEIEEFIINKKQPELAIIRHKYPNQVDIKVSLFGRKKWIKTVKMKLQLIINKHTLRRFDIKMTVPQYEYLLDNCAQQLKDLESQYSDDNVKIRIRQKEFYAPQYLIDKIKQQIYELICSTARCIVRKIGNHVLLTDEDKTEVTRIAIRHGCRIEKIDSKTEVQSLEIPKALTETSFTSSLFLEQSKQFCSSLSVRKLRVLNGSIEIHKADRSILLTSDFTVISTDAGAAEEYITPSDDNQLFETHSGRKILFKRWTSVAVDEHKTSSKLKKSIGTFIGSIIQTIAVQCPNAATITFSTRDWKNFHSKQQFAEELLIQLRQAMIERKSSWRVLFVFSDKQNDLFEKFNAAMMRVPDNEDSFGQYSCSISTTEILLTTSKGNNLAACEKEINDYLYKHISTIKNIKSASELGRWDQHVINTFYKYCLDKSVLPIMNLTTHQLQLIGSPSDVERTMRKYQSISEILKQRSSVRIPPPVTPRSSLSGRNKLNPMSNNGYNIAFSYCQPDEVVCSHLVAFLIGEGYLVCQGSYDNPLSQSEIDKSDVLLIYFNENYPQDEHCMININYAKSISKTIIPIAAIRNSDSNAEQSSWLGSVTIAGLFYDIFNSEIELEFTGDCDLDYDRILIVLLRHTKPGLTGKTYPQAQTSMQTTSIDTEYEQPVFGHMSPGLQKLTERQRKEREKAYQLKVKTQMEKEKISADDINTLVGQMMQVTEDLERIIRGEKPPKVTSDDPHLQRYQTTHEDQAEYSPIFAKEFLDCVKRWCEKAPDVIQKTIPPFTPTGDINDAVFIIHSRSTNTPWWLSDDQSSENLPVTNDKIPPPQSTQGSSFTHEQAHDYFQQSIRADGRILSFDTQLEKDEIVWDTVSISDDDNEGTAKDEDEIDDKWKTPEEIQKIEKLDDPKRVWKIEKGTMLEKFIKQKIRNMIEFQQLCNNQTIRK